MTPWREALAAVDAAGISDDTLHKMMAHALTDGVFYSGPDAFLIAFDEENMWQIWLAAGGPGAMAKFFALAPYPRPLVAWERRCRGRSALVVHPWERVRRLVNSACVAGCNGANQAHERPRQAGTKDQPSFKV